MAVQLEDYIPVEEGVAEWLYGMWDDVARPLVKGLIQDVEDGEFDDAMRAINSIDVQSIALGAAKGLENHAVTALTFGAMLAKGNEKVMYIDQPLPPVIDPVVKQYQAVFPRIQKTIRQTLIRFFQKQEPTQKSDSDHAYCEHSSYQMVVDQLLKSDVLTIAQKLNAVVLGQARSAIDIAANLNTSRLVGLGFLQQSMVEGITTYQITAVLDQRVCGVCRSLNGQTFNVQSGISRLMTILQMTDPDALKLAAPFPSQQPDAVAALKGMSQAQLEAGGLSTPPYHPGCRCRQVMVGQKTTVTTTVVDQPTTEMFESVFAQSTNAGSKAAAAAVSPFTLEELKTKTFASLKEWIGEIEDGYSDPKSRSIAEKMGWNSKGIKKATAQELETAAVMYRGWSDKKHMLAYEEDAGAIGKGIFGDGFYYSSKMDTAKGYAGDDVTKVHTHYVVKEARVLEVNGSKEFDKIVDAWEEELLAFGVDKDLAWALKHEINFMAAVKGYDVIKLTRSSGEIYYVVFNKNVVRRK